MGIKKKASQSSKVSQQSKLKTVWEIFRNNVSYRKIKKKEFEDLWYITRAYLRGNVENKSKFFIRFENQNHCILWAKIEKRTILPVINAQDKSQHPDVMAVL